MNDVGRIVILGAGPTGLGAAYRLQELGITEYVVLEAKDQPGGLASSYKDTHGFTWDLGGHVHFSHYPYYDAVLDRVLGDRRVYHNREAWIWMKRRFVPYPFQYNLHRLDRADRDRALAGLEHCVTHQAETPTDFGAWIQQTFGSGIADLFMNPYNEKVWGYPLETLGFNWIGERVPVPDLARVRQSIDEEHDDRTWGPNSWFFYPLEGGTGSIWHGIAKGLDTNKLMCNAAVSAIDVRAHRVYLEDDRSHGYESLITTMPLDSLCRICTGLDSQVTSAAEALVHSSCHVIGIGLEGDMPASLRRKSWIYFPEPHTPYYRVTILSNYSHTNVPPGGEYWSLMAEVCETPQRHVDRSRLVTNVINAMRHDKLIPEATTVVSTWHQRVEYGYPTPFLGRDAQLARILPALEDRRVYSRGRFGSWRYEVSNQDHCFMQGVELVNRLLGIGEETTLFNYVVSAGRRRRLSARNLGREQ